MKNISKALSIVLLLISSVMFNHCAPGQKTQVTPTYVEEVPKTIEKIYFKDGKVIQCDIVWEGTESDILCKKSDDILAYSTDEVDLGKTFGETDAKEIAKRYEKIKGREETVKILKSIGTHTGFAVGTPSYTADGILISNFVVNRKTRYINPRFKQELYIASFGVKNLKSDERFVYVCIRGVDSNGNTVHEETLSKGYTVPSGGFTKFSHILKCSDSKAAKITKWEIYDIYTHELGWEWRRGR